MLCSQCDAPAERCTRCAAALCTRRLCAELHEVSCEAVSALPVGAPLAAPTPVLFTPRTRHRRERNTEAERAIAEHRRSNTNTAVGSGRVAHGDLDLAFDSSGPRAISNPTSIASDHARQSVPHDFELNGPDAAGSGAVRATT